MSGGVRKEHPSWAHKDLIVKVAEIETKEMPETARGLSRVTVKRRLSAMEATNVEMKKDFFGRGGAIFAGVYFEASEDAKQFHPLFESYGVINEKEKVEAVLSLREHPIVCGYAVASLFAFPKARLDRVYRMLVQGTPVIIVAAQGKAANHTKTAMLQYIRFWDLGAGHDVTETDAAALGGVFFPNAAVKEKPENGNIRRSMFGDLCPGLGFLVLGAGTSDPASSLVPCPLSLGRFLVSVTETLKQNETREAKETGRMFERIKEQSTGLFARSMAERKDFTRADAAVHAMRVSFFVLFPEVWNITPNDLKEENSIVDISLRFATDEMVGLVLKDEIDANLFVHVAEAQVLGAMIFGFCFKNLDQHFADKVVVFDVCKEHIWRVPREVRGVGQ